MVSPSRSDRVEVIDLRREIQLCGDEAGTFDFRPSPHDRYFLIVTVAIPDSHIASELDALADHIRTKAGDDVVGDAFHAKDDTPLTRDQVFDLLAEHDLAVDATIVDKSTVPTRLRRDLQAFYTLMWSQHLLHVLPGMLYPPAKVMLTAAEMGLRSKEPGFQAAIAMATAFSYMPFIEALTPLVSPHAATNWLVNMPALGFTYANPQDNRLLQVADYCAWAIQRNLHRPDETRNNEQWYGQIEHMIRSERFVTMEDKGRAWAKTVPTFSGVMTLPKMRGTHNEFAVRSTYRRGPADSFQARLSMAHEIFAGDLAGALDMLETIDFDNVFLDVRFTTFIKLIALMHTAVEADPATAIRCTEVLAKATECLIRRKDGPPSTQDLHELIFLASRAQEGLRGRPEGARTAEVAMRLCEYALQHMPGDRAATALLVMAMYNRALRLGTSQADEALVGYSQVIARFDEVADPPTAVTVARAYVNKGNLLRRRGERDRALACFLTVIDRHGHEPAELFHEPVVKAYLGAGELASENGDAELNLDLLCRIQPWLDQVMDIELHRNVASRFQKQAQYLFDHDDSTTALAFVEAIWGRYADEDDSEIIESRLRASSVRRDIARNTGQFEIDRELPLLDHEIAGLAGRADLRLRIIRARALGDRLSMTIAADRAEKALRISDEVLRACEDLPEDAVALTRALARVQRGGLLQDMGQFQDATREYDAAEVLLDGRHETWVPGLVAHLLVGRASMLSRENKPDQACELLKDALDRFDGNADPIVQQAVEQARIGYQHLGEEV